jgi:ATP-binding protein involved in chromosome partitioning
MSIELATNGLSGVKSILAVVSAKGGVGKSSVTANLACALRDAGLAIGVCDLDVSCPSLDTMFGIDPEDPGNMPYLTEDSLIEPPLVRGLKVSTMGTMAPQDKALAWRGPVMHSAVQQLLQSTNWADLDVLLCDMPPGTGDVNLSLAQTAPVTGAVVVTTPQRVAVADVARGIDLYRELGIPILGMVKNMDGLTCKVCGTHHDVFGGNDVEALAAAADVELLGSVPIAPEVRFGGDAGKPVVEAEPASAPATAFRAIAEKVKGLLAATSVGGDAFETCTEEEIEI